LTRRAPDVRERERARERERERKSETERESERERARVCVYERERERDRFWISRLEWRTRVESPTGVLGNKFMARTAPGSYRRAIPGST